eukprot:g21385.t1
MTHPNKLIILPYIKNTFELTTRLLQLLAIRVAHKPTSTLCQLLTRTNDPLPNMGRTNFDCKNTRILGQAMQRQAQEFLEAWFSTKKAINKHRARPHIHSIVKKDQ